MLMPKYPDGEFNQNQYINDFQKEKYERVALQVYKGNREKLRELAVRLNIRDEKGKVSVNKLIINALEKTYDIDLSNPKQK